MMGTAQNKHPRAGVLYAGKRLEFEARTNRFTFLEHTLPKNEQCLTFTKVEIKTISHYLNQDQISCSGKRPYHFDIPQHITHIDEFGFSMAFQPLLLVDGRGCGEKNALQYHCKWHGNPILNNAVNTLFNNLQSKLT